MECALASFLLCIKSFLLCSQWESPSRGKGYMLPKDSLHCLSGITLTTWSISERTNTSRFLFYWLTDFSRVFAKDQTAEASPFPLIQNTWLIY